MNKQQCSIQLCILTVCLLCADCVPHEISAVKTSEEYVLSKKTTESGTAEWLFILNNAFFGNTIRCASEIFGPLYEPNHATLIDVAYDEHVFGRIAQYREKCNFYTDLIHESWKNTEEVVKDNKKYEPFMIKLLQDIVLACFLNDFKNKKQLKESSIMCDIEHNSETIKDFLNIDSEIGDSWKTFKNIVVDSHPIMPFIMSVQYRRLIRNALPSRKINSHTKQPLFCLSAAKSHYWQAGPT